LARFSAFFAWLAFEFLKALKIVEIKTIQAEKEVIEI
jgi:hypothetical protein